MTIEHEQRRPVTEPEARAWTRASKRYLELATYTAELEQLVKWLALPYGDNSPIFATALPDGRLLETGVRMRAVYRAVVGDKQWTAGTWVTCDCCGQMYVNTELLYEPVPDALEPVPGDPSHLQYRRTRASNS